MEHQTHVCQPLLTTIMPTSTINATATTYHLSSDTIPDAVLAAAPHAGPVGSAALAAPSALIKDPALSE